MSQSATAVYPRRRIFILPPAVSLGAVCAISLGVLVIVYIVTYSSNSIWTYASGNSLFDLGAFEQGFWNATKGTLFDYSLEGEMSRFGRHFSPIFIAFVPIYSLHRDASTLLVLQSVALGLAAIPLYLFARRRTGNPVVALVIAALYLANPATHDVNMVNEFHEVAFAVPLLFLAFYAVDTGRWKLYALSMLGALMVKEEIALTVAAFGLYLLLFVRQRRIGAITFAGSVVWFMVVVGIVMPALRGPYGPIPFDGYDYLGSGAFGIGRGVITNSSQLLHTMVSPPQKLDYLIWLLEPVAFLALLAPEVLLAAVPALLEVLASTYPPTYQIFERYVAPILPFVFVAATIGVCRLQRALGAAKVRRQIVEAIPIGLVLAMIAGTLYAQSVLQKYPTQLFRPAVLSAHVATALRFTAAIPEQASITTEDHRWLAHLAHRRYLYFLSAKSPDADYLLLDRRVPPITNAPQEARDAAIRRVLNSPDYVGLRCEDGISLYARRDAHARDGTIFPQFSWDHDLAAGFGDAIRLQGYSLAQTKGALTVRLYWEAVRDPGADYTAGILLLDRQQRPVAERDAPPDDGACRTSEWKQGEMIEDVQVLNVGSRLAPGDYVLEIGLYEPTAMKRLPAARGAAGGSNLIIPVLVH